MKHPITTFITNPRISEIICSKLVRSFLWDFMGGVASSGDFLNCRGGKAKLYTPEARVQELGSAVRWYGAQSLNQHKPEVLLQFLLISLASIVVQNLGFSAVAEAPGSFVQYLCRARV